MTDDELLRKWRQFEKTGKIISLLIKITLVIAILATAFNLIVVLK